MFLKYEGKIMRKNEQHSLLTEVRKYRDVPTLFINGKPHAAMTYMTYNAAFEHVAEFSKAEVPIVSFSTTPDHSYFNMAPDSWRAPGHFDYTDFEKRVERILATHPNAYLLPRLYICTPRWWNDAHPEEMMVGHMQSPTEATLGRFPSFSSIAWKKASGNALTRFIRYVERQPYADRIIGYHLASGFTEEWYYTGYWDDVTQDFSEPQRRAFGRWLQERYKTVDRLRQAWEDRIVSFKTVTVPGRPERMNTDLGEFRGVSGVNRKVADYYEFHSHTVANAIRYFSALAKSACGHRKIIGAFYGYLMEMPVAEMGHIALREVLQCPDVNFMTAPSSYSHRYVARGASLFMAPLASVRAHGKLWIDENDLRTHHVPYVNGFFPTTSPKETENIQLRELAHVLTEATGMWWFDMRGGWYADPATMSSIRRMASLADKALHFNRSSAAQIAVVLDARSLCYLRPGTQFTAPLISNQRLDLVRLCAPVDYLLLDDLPSSRPYRFYIFLNAFRIDPQQRKTIQRIVRRNGCWSLWISAAGLLGDQVNAAGIEQLTGIPVKFSRMLGAYDFTVMPDTELTRAGCPAWTTGGLAATSTSSAAAVCMSPYMIPEDGVSDVWARSPTSGKPVVVAQHFDGWTSVYSAVPNIPSAILRAMARMAGVHVYAENDDPIYVNRSFLGIHARTAGRKHLCFPRRTEVYDPYREELLSADCSNVEFNMKAGDTRLLFMGKRSDWTHAEAIGKKQKAIKCD
jgi:hypothetical protein